jgi:NTE family protein
MTTPRPDGGLPPIDLFADLSGPDKEALGSRFETLPVRRGDALVRQGEEADALYVVLSGRFSVTLHGRRGAVNEVGAGQPVGEIAFLTGGRRTATVTAMRDSLVLRLSRGEFEELASAHPAIWRTLTATLARRLAETTAAVPLPPDPRPRTLCLIRAGGSPVPAEFTRLLVRVFEAHARTLVVSSENAAETLGGADLASAATTQALNTLESGYDYVLFLADPELTPWTEKAIRHADLLLAAARHHADPTPNALERLAAEFLAPEARRLLLLHERKGRVSGTARWLAERAVAMHHHVALDGPADVERLYRFVSGTARGLVACGGGALCAAHIGVYKALVEGGTEFDIMGGTSAGSAMVAAFALGTAPDEVDRCVHDMFVVNKAMRRYTWPRYSLLDHTNFDAQLRRYFGGTDIEDLWLPFFAVSTNLSRFRLHHHRHGSLWTAVRASGSIPVLLPPVYTSDGEMLVDGCLLDNVPVRAMQEVKSGPNVVVSFMIPELERFAVAYETLPSRAELVRLALNPLRRDLLPPAPGLTAVLMRSLMANRRDFQRHMTGEDLLLVPPLPKSIGFLDWHRHTELYRSAYRWTLEELQRLKVQGERNGWCAGAAAALVPAAVDGSVSVLGAQQR